MGARGHLGPGGDAPGGADTAFTRANEPASKVNPAVWGLFAAGASAERGRIFGPCGILHVSI